MAQSAAFQAFASSTDTLTQDCAIHHMNEWPLLISEYHRRPDDLEFEQYLRFVIGLLERKQRFVILIDNHHPDTMGRERGMRMSRWYRDNRMGLSQFMPGIAIISREMSPLRRFAASAMMSLMSSNHMHHEFFSTLDEGKSWARKLVSKGARPSSW